jgi:hypothetical protein
MAGSIEDKDTNPSEDGASSTIDDSSAIQHEPTEDTTEEFEERVRSFVGGAEKFDELPLQVPIEEKDYDPRPATDGARRIIAYWLLLLLTVLIFAALYFFCRLFNTDKPPSFDDIKNMIGFILTPLITLVSAATGFYFGSNNHSSNNKK